MARDDVVDAELSRLRPERGLENDLEQEIAELFAMLGGVVQVDRFEDLVGLLDQIALERTERLLAIPRAAVWSEQALHDGHQLGERLAVLPGLHRGHKSSKMRAKIREPLPGEVP